MTRELKIKVGLDTSVVCISMKEIHLHNKGSYTANSMVYTECI